MAEQSLNHTSDRGAGNIFIISKNKHKHIDNQNINQLFHSSGFSSFVKEI